MPRYGLQYLTNKVSWQMKKTGDSKYYIGSLDFTQPSVTYTKVGPLDIDPLEKLLFAYTRLKSSTQYHIVTRDKRLLLKQIVPTPGVSYLSF